MSTVQLEGERAHHLVFDSFNVEIIIKVLKLSVFSHFFAIFVPLTIRGQGYPWFSTPTVYGMIYAGLVCFFHLASHLLTIATSPKPYLLQPGFVDWQDQIVLITGGASGLGGLLAETLAMRGVRVVVLDVRKGEWEGEVGVHNISWYQCDVSKKAEVDACAKRIREEIGDPTMLVNNAGVVQGKKILDLSEEEVNETIGVNLAAQFWILKAFLPKMIEKGTGHVMTVASVMGLVGSARMTDYCATKAAVIQLHESLKFELKSQYKTPSIHTSLLLPSFIHTPLFSTAQLPRSRFFRFFAPELEPHEVVKKMIGILSVEASQTGMWPSYVKVVPWIRWVKGVREVAQWFSGADHAMDNFVRAPRKVVTPAEDEDEKRD
ncbi:retinal short-chain dehydrogenase/reductase [Mrakia frigida]|uniref:retinal short-chain dehydrogenase/reductase n=1 Tax=Mrakia frigida TaxID=29902 RepID=UPI003FCC2454